MRRIACSAFGPAPWVLSFFAIGLSSPIPSLACFLCKYLSMYRGFLSSRIASASIRIDGPIGVATVVGKRDNDVVMDLRLLLQISRAEMEAYSVESRIHFGCVLDIDSIGCLNGPRP